MLRLPIGRGAASRGRARARHARGIFSGPRRQSGASPDAYCLQLVRKHDYEHYLCCLLLPRAVRTTAFAVRALNVDVAQIRDMVSEKRIGEMRVLFWRDAIEKAFQGDPPQQPIAMALAKAIKKHKLSKMWFMRLLDAREKELSTNAYLSTQALEDYSENTFSAILYLVLEALGVRVLQADHAASHVGRAEGVASLLRATAYLRSRRRVLIPLDIATRHGASQQDFLSGEASLAVRDTVFDCASLAHTHLQKARSLKERLPSAAASALLPAVACESFLRRIQRVNFDPFQPSLTSRDSLLPLTLAWRSLQGVY